MTTTSLTAAEIVFVERPEGGRWEARLLSPSTSQGLIYDRPVADRKHILWITQDADDSYSWTTPGEHKRNGNRHHWASNLDEAQARVRAWAARRFRTEC